MAMQLPKNVENINALVLRLILAIFSGKMNHQLVCSFIWFKSSNFVCFFICSAQSGSLLQPFSLFCLFCRSFGLSFRFFFVFWTFVYDAIYEKQTCNLSKESWCNSWNFNVDVGCFSLDLFVLLIGFLLSVDIRQTKK